MIIVLFVISRIPKESYGSLNRSSGAFLLNDGAKKVQMSAEPSLLELCRVQPFLLRSAKIRLFSDTTKFRVAIRTDFQQLLILNSVNKTNSYFSKKENIVLLREKLWVLFQTITITVITVFQTTFPNLNQKLTIDII